MVPVAKVADPFLFVGGEKGQTRNVFVYMILGKMIMFLSKDIYFLFSRTLKKTYVDTL